mmetsp:Transcript_50015/g.93146  ORF Transcript_50015/g.93146 Transcript_50015/m.93146 type:complete len:269 (-) Transcript_50015:672-1478(-)
MAARKEKRSTFARPVMKLDRYPEAGSGGVDLSLFGKEGRTSYEAAMADILKAYPAIGKGSGLTDKVVLVGDQNVGKTCLVLRYCEDTFWDNYKATIGVDFMWQRYLIQGIGFTLHLWDTAGQEKFRSLSQAYYRGARACIAAFDLGVPESLEHCKHWVSEVKAENQQTFDTGDFCVFLVGCKADHYKVVDRKEAEKLANKIGAEYFEVSSKTEEGVKNLFERVAVVLFERAITRAKEAMSRAEGTGPRASKGVKLGASSAAASPYLCC